MATPSEAYAADVWEQISKYQSEEKAATEGFTGKQAHKCKGVADLKKISTMVPSIVNKYKATGKSKIYMASWADHLEGNVSAPFVCTTQVRTAAQRHTHPGAAAGRMHRHALSDEPVPTMRGPPRAAAPPCTLRTLAGTSHLWPCPPARSLRRPAMPWSLRPRI